MPQQQVLRVQQQRVQPERLVQQALEGLAQQAQQQEQPVQQRERQVQQEWERRPLRRLPITMRAPQWRPKLPLVSSSS